MAPEYKLVVSDTSGVKLAEVTDFLNLEYRKQVNYPGIATFVLGGRHAAISQLTLDGQVAVWRRDVAQGIAWYTDFEGLYRGGKQATNAQGRDTFLAYCPGHMSLLGRRIVAWYAGTTSRSEFTSVSAESLMKVLVQFNCGVSATTGAGRLRNGALSGITIQTDSAAGNTISWSCAWKNLLDQLQEIAKIAGGDIDLVKTGPTTREFRFYPGQLGTNRTVMVTFGLAYGNMAEPEYELLRMDEQTIAIVGGQGEQSSRAIVTRTGPGYSAANDIELFVDGRNDDTTTKLNSRGDAKLDATRARNAFSYKVLQTPASLYGKHYFLGDLVTARYKTIQVSQQVYTVTVKLDATGKEDISVEMRDL